MLCGTLTVLPLPCVYLAVWHPPLCGGRCVHREVPMVDGHNDLPWAIRRVHQANVSAFNLSVPQTQVGFACPVAARLCRDLDKGTQLTR